MATVPRALLDEYTEKLNSLSEASQQLVINALDGAQWDSVAQLRNILVAAMDQVCFTAADHARVIAAGMYDDVRQIAVGKRLGYLPGLEYDPNATDGAVRAFVQSVEKTGTTGELRRLLAERVDYEIKKAAGDCTAAFCRMDRLKPRYARIPSGRETCRFCIMLASRGFVYGSGKAAGSGNHYHAKCDCRIVQGYAGMDVEGYDPDAYYRVWRRLENAETVATKLYVGGPVALQKEAGRLGMALGKEWNAHKAIDSSARAYRDTYGRFVESQSVRGAISIEDFTHIEGKELQLGTWLSGIGMDVEFRNPDKAFRRGDKTSDIILDGGRYEAKRIESPNPKKIGTRINKNLDMQGPRFIVDLSLSRMPREEAETKVAWLLEDPRIEEIILIKSKTLKRFTK